MSNYELSLDGRARMQTTVCMVVTSHHLHVDTSKYSQVFAFSMSRLMSNYVIQTKSLTSKLKKIEIETENM
jgi:hypothetical protein